MMVQKFRARLIIMTKKYFEFKTEAGTYTVVADDKGAASKVFLNYMDDSIYIGTDDASHILDAILDIKEINKGTMTNKLKDSVYEDGDPVGLSNKEIKNSLNTDNVIMMEFK